MEIAPLEEWLVISAHVLQLVLVGKALVPEPGPWWWLQNSRGTSGCLLEVLLVFL